MNNVGEQLSKFQSHAKATSSTKTEQDFRPISGKCQTLPHRNLGSDVCRVYGYSVGEYQGKRTEIAEYRDSSGSIVAQHIRLDPKAFRWIGKTSIKELQLFGQHLGSSGTLILTEGEIDAMSVYEALRQYSVIKGRWCCASIASGAGSAQKQIQEAANLDWVLGFTRIIILFDQDESGREAAKKVAELIGPKAAIAEDFPYKDANAAWVQKDGAAIRHAIISARVHRPPSIVHAADIRERILNPDIVKGLEFPWQGWNEKAPTGMRPGELWLISGGTGIGKSLFTRSIAVNLLRKGVKVAYVGLEESIETTLDRMVSELMGETFYLYNKEQRQSAKERANQALDILTPNLLLMDQFGGDSFDTFVNNVRYYVLAEECKIVFLDHFSLLADGIALGTDQRRAIDKCIKELKTMAVELGFTLVCVCHLSRDNSGSRPAEEGGEPHLAQLRGSHSLAQIPDYIVMLQRNPSLDDAERNVTSCWLKKNRVSGELGLMSRLEFNPQTYQLNPPSFDQ